MGRGPGRLHLGPGCSGERRSDRGGWGALLGFVAGVFFFGLVLSWERLEMIGGFFYMGLFV